MNKERRKQLQEAIEKINSMSDILEEIKSIIESCRYDEEEYRDNMPENLQGSEKYEKAENAIGSLDEAYDALDDIDVDEIISSIEEAME